MKAEISLVNIIPNVETITLATFGDLLQDLKNAINTKTLAFNETITKEAYKKYFTEDKKFLITIYK